MDVQELRQSAHRIWEAALNAANPSTYIQKFIQASDRGLFIGEKHIEVRGRLIVIGAGKASSRMAQAVEEILGSQISGGLVVTKYGHSLPLRRIKLVEAGHPVPDSSGINAALETRELLRDLTPDDIVLCLISGGASALWTAPAQGLSLGEIQEITSGLLRAGATIRELNAVRKHLSALAGGQMAQWAAPAHVITLIVSDVIGDPIDFIGSGPTAPDSTSFSDAHSILQKYAIQLPESVGRRIHDGVRGLIPETPKEGDPVFRNVSHHIVANNSLLIEAAMAKARELNLNTLVLGTEVEGEAKEVGGFFAAIAREIGRSGNPVKPPACILAAGETTVTVNGDGTGGRNQEMALAWAISMAARPVSAPSCFASIATDGTDGPTTAAGGLVDHLTCLRGIEQGMTPSKFLRGNDSWNFLKTTGDLIVTGPTHTNLMDLQILLVGRL